MNCAGAVATACCNAFEDYRSYLHLFSNDCDVERTPPAENENNADDLRRVAFVDLIPSASEQRKIFALLDEMTGFDVITTKLQRQDMTVATVRDMFGGILEYYENMEKYLAADANIVELPEFERGLAKFQAGVESTLSRTERKALNRLLVSPQAPPPATSTRAATCSRLTASQMKRKRAAEALEEKISKKARKRSAPASKFVDVSRVPPTSVAAERLFSTVKRTVGYLQKSMSHDTLEVVMFLKLNWDLVTLADVSKPIERSKSTESAEV
ncbi:hypothetical protein PF010_g12003 [Phytophthora fragariae]|uniref:HAT C-terminal dimerisation domain-containing protein n=1 Tax=Phytophthora fragariae TaxID=53985 RepID=A0A6G0L408_9STRA|nr:hypothetical protein PF010_g12003 [Phytophthora fragariae]KAE9199520.1 hypothetical protein PF004_g19249 [Phytophthora fragariae]